MLDWILGYQIYNSTYCFPNASNHIFPLVVNFFDIAIRLQQSDPLSPILFVLVMNTRQNDLKGDWNLKAWNDLILNQYKEKHLLISHMLFIGGVTLIFCDANFDPIKCLRRCILSCFNKVVSSHRVNLSKSKLVPVGGVKDPKTLANFLVCIVDSSNFHGNTWIYLWSTF